MMYTMPKPRRKQWWEKLLEEQYDHFYEDAEKLKIPNKFQGIYKNIVEHRKIKEVILLQRFMRKRIHARWLKKQEAHNQRTYIDSQGTEHRQVTIDVGFLTQRQDSCNAF